MIVTALAIAAPASASAATVQVMVVGKNSTLRSAKGVRLKQRTVTVSHRRCAVAAATPLSVLAATHLDLAFRDYGHCGKRPADASGLYVTSVAVGGNAAQRLDDLGGKVLRLNDDGSVPPDNPFMKNPANAKKEIYTLGHRSSLGLALHPVTGEMWLNENGPNGGDEINILKPGANYGWPLVSYGRSYPGPWQNGRAAGHDGFEPPIVYWMPSIAVSGMAFYTGDKLPKWKGDVFVGSLRTGEIPGTGHLERILFNEKMEEMRREYLLFGLGQRIRDVRQSLDGYLYLCTDMQEGAVLRIEPAQ